MRTLVKFDYDEFLLPTGDIGTAVSLISGMRKIESRGYGKDRVYVVSDKQPALEIFLVADDQIAETEDDPRNVKHLQEQVKSLNESYTKYLLEADRLRKLAEAHGIDTKVPEVPK